MSPINKATAESAFMGASADLARILARAEAKWNAPDQLTDMVQTWNTMDPELKEIFRRVNPTFFRDIDQRMKEVSNAKA
jgi:hypothetical protein